MAKQRPSQRSATGASKPSAAPPSPGAPTSPEVPAGRRGLFTTRGLAARPRIAALILAFIGYVLTEVNRLTVRNERNFYPMLMLFGPVCILIGIAGAVDPRIMRHADIGDRRTRNLFRVLMITLVLAGMAIGWAMAHFWYKIW